MINAAKSEAEIERVDKAELLRLEDEVMAPLRDPVLVQRGQKKVTGEDVARQIRQQENV